MTSCERDFTQGSFRLFTSQRARTSQGWEGPKRTSRQYYRTERFSLARLPRSASRQPRPSSQNLLLDRVKVNLELGKPRLAVVVRPSFKFVGLGFGCPHNLGCTGMGAIGDLMSGDQPLCLRARLSKELIGLSLGSRQHGLCVGNDLIGCGNLIRNRVPGSGNQIKDLSSVHKDRGAHRHRASCCDQRAHVVEDRQQRR